MQSIELNNNILSTSHPDAFDSCHIILLNLSNNKNLSYISNQTFHSTDIKRLSVANTSLRTYDFFSNLRYSITWLDWSYSNVELFFYKHIFANFFFEYLNITSSGLKSIYFLKDTVVEILILDDNPDLGNSRYDHMRGLQKSVNYLSLSNTSLSNLHQFLRLTNLHTLIIDRNNVKFLDRKEIGLLQSLKYFSMKSNTLHCNCQLIQFKNWLRTIKSKLKYFLK